MADKTIELEVNKEPSAKGARKVLVTPLADESQLYYYNWVQNNIKKVNEATPTVKWVTSIFRTWELPV